MHPTVNNQDLLKAIKDDSIGALIVRTNFKDLSLLGEFLGKAHNNKHFDLFEWYKTSNYSDLSREAITRWYTVLQHSILFVNANPEKVFGLYQFLTHESSDNLHYMLEKGYRGWATANPIYMEIISAHIEKLNIPSLLLRQTIISWILINPDAAYLSALRFSKSKIPVIRVQAISTLSSFGVDFILDKPCAQRRLIELVHSDDENDVRASIRCLLCILKISDNSDFSSLRMLLDELVINPIPYVRNELILGMGHSKNAFSVMAKNHTLESMKLVPSSNYQTINSIDSVLYDLDIERDREIIYEIVTSLMSLEDEPTEIETLSLTMCNLQAATHSQRGWYVVRWLLEGNKAICDQLNLIFSPLDVKLYDIKVDLEADDAAEVFYLARKTFGYFLFCRGPAVSILCACLSILSLKDRKTLETMIAEFWLRNYPSDTALFVNHYTSYPNKGMKASVRRMVRQHKQKTDGLRGITANPAFRPSPSEQRIQREISRKEQREMVKNAHEHSIFSQIASKSTLLHGRSAITYVRTEGSDEFVRHETKMNSYELATARPRMQVLSPSHLNYMICLYRNEQFPE